MKEFHFGMILSDALGVLTNAAHEYPRKEEIREHHNPLEPQLHHMAQPRFHQGEGDTGIDRFTPAESEPLHQHPHHFGHVGVGIRI